MVGIENCVKHDILASQRGKMQRRAFVQRIEFFTKALVLPFLEPPLQGSGGTGIVGCNSMQVAAGVNIDPKPDQ